MENYESLSDADKSSLGEYHRLSIKKKLTKQEKSTLDGIIICINRYLKIELPIDIRRKIENSIDNNPH